MRLDEGAFHMYLSGMDILSAQESLMLLKISCAPDMNRNARQKFVNELQKSGNPHPPKAITHEEMARILNG